MVANAQKRNVLPHKHIKASHRPRQSRVTRLGDRRISSRGSDASKRASIFFSVWRILAADRCCDPHGSGMVTEGCVSSLALALAARGSSCVSEAASVKRISCFVDINDEAECWDELQMTWTTRELPQAELQPYGPQKDT